MYECVCVCNYSSTPPQTNHPRLSVLFSLPISPVLTWNHCVPPPPNLRPFSNNGKGVCFSTLLSRPRGVQWHVCKADFNRARTELLMFKVEIPLFCCGFSKLKHHQTIPKRKWTLNLRGTTHLVMKSYQNY